MLKFNKNIQNTCNKIEEVSIVPGSCCCCCSCCCICISVGSGHASSGSTTPAK